MLAEALSLTLGQVRALPNAEIEEWRAFHDWRRVTQEHAEKVAAQKAK